MIQKRLFAVLMAISVSYAFFQSFTRFAPHNIIVAAAENIKSGKCGENATYTLDSNGKLTITGTGTMNDTSSPFFEKSEIKSVIINSGITNIGKSAFYHCYNLETVSIPDTVTSIGDYAFYECSSIKTINLSDSVTSIGEKSFANCKILSTVEMPDSLTSIGDNAFSNCTNLSNCSIPKSVTNIGFSSFSGTIWLRKMSQETPLVIINNILIDGSLYSENELVIPETVLSISGSAFYDNKNIQSITLNDSITKIERGTFTNCSNLTSVYLGKSIEDIGQGAFGSCKNLSAINIPDSVKTIGLFAFHECVGLKKVVFGKNLEKIGPCAFENTGVITITLPESVKEIEEDAFKNCPLQSFTILNKECNIYPSITTICNTHDKNGNYYYTGIISGVKGSTAENYAQQFDIQFEELSSSDEGFAIITKGNWGDNLTYTLDENGTLNIKGTGDMNDSYQFSIDKEIKSSTKKVIINQGITSIGNGVFSGFTSINEVSIPNSTIKIGDNAFRGCISLVSINFPSSIKEMGFHVFDSCSKLASITIPSSLKTINEGTFNGCSSLSSIEIPESIETIDSYAFNGCETLTSVIIPKTVKSIGEKAFNNCSNLKAITFYNPECKIFEQNNTICNFSSSTTYSANYSGVIEGYNNSSAENYADKYNVLFVDLSTKNNSTTTMTTITTPLTTTVTTTTSYIIQSTQNYNLGDLNNDGYINAVDASTVLTYYAMISTNKDGGFDEAQKNAADVNHDSLINAVDASCILSYYAYVSTTREDILSVEDYLKKK